MKIEVVDLYQVHAPDTETPFEVTANLLDELHREGKIRAIGLSNFSLEQMGAFSEAAPIHSLQPRYSMLNRSIESDILPYCIEHSVATCVYCPLERGLLTDRVRPGSEFPEDDSRRDDPDFQGEEFARTKRMVDKLKPIAEECGKTVAQLTLNWTIHQPGVTVAIVGAKRPDQVLENAGAVSFEMSAEQMRRVTQIVEAR